MNACLDMLRSRCRRVLPADVAAPVTSSWTEPSEWGAPGMDIPWLEPYPDQFLPETNPEATVELREARATAVAPGGSSLGTAVDQRRADSASHDVTFRCRIRSHPDRGMLAKPHDWDTAYNRSE